MKAGLLIGGWINVVFGQTAWAWQGQAVVGALLIIAAALYEIAGELHRNRP